MFDCIEQYAPGFKDSVIGRDILTPPDLEQVFGLTGGVRFQNFIQPFPKRQILDCSQLKESADDNFIFGEGGRKLLKWVENTVGKGEIAYYEQFLRFPQYFQKTCTADT